MTMRKFDVLKNTKILLINRDRIMAKCMKIQPKCITIIHLRSPLRKNTVLKLDT